MWYVIVPSFVGYCLGSSAAEAPALPAPAPNMTLSLHQTVSYMHTDTVEHACSYKSPVNMFPKINRTDCPMEHFFLNFHLHYSKKNYVY